MKEIELAGIAVAHICSMTPVAYSVGSNRIIIGNGIIHPTGNPELEPELEKAFRRTIVEKALEALQTEVQEQKIFPRPK